MKQQHEGNNGSFHTGLISVTTQQKYSLLCSPKVGLIKYTNLQNKTTSYPPNYLN